MNVLRTVAAVREWRASAGRVSLVPTRDVLNEGQSALVDRAIRQNDAANASRASSTTRFLGVRLQDLDQLQ